jgi:hypothetical protein
MDIIIAKALIVLCSLGATFTLGKINGHYVERSRVNRLADDEAKFQAMLDSQLSRLASGGRS